MNPMYVLRTAWVACVVTIIVASLIPDSTASTLVAVSWNPAHVPAYAVLTILTFFVQPMRHESLVAAVVGATLLGLALEVVQPWFGRTASFQDYLANELGVAIGAVMSVLIARWRGAEAL